MGQLALVATIAQGVLGVLSAQQEGAAAADQAEAEAAEFRRQQDVAKEREREAMSDRTRQADREMASMIAAMAENGGLGTTNATGLAVDIGGIEGLDLARIQGNTRREIEALESRARASIARGRNAVKNASLSALGSVIGASGKYGQLAEEQRRADEEATLATLDGTATRRATPTGGPATRGRIRI